MLLAAAAFKTIQAKKGKTKVFSESLVGRNAAIICSKDDPLNIPGSVFRVISSDTIARYPNLDIANSWDMNWGAAIRIPCTGATALENMKMRA